MDKIVKSQKRLRLKNRAVAWLMAALMCFSALPIGSMTVHATDAETVTYWTDNAATAFDSGDGTEGNPYIVATEAQLAYMAQVLSGEDAADYKSCYYKVADNVTALDMPAHEWTPIPEFAGVFDGNGVTIDGLTIKTTSTDKVGFFSVLNEGAKVQNVDFTNVNIDASCGVNAEFCVGTIAGRVNGATIDNCKVLSGTVKATGQATNRDIFVGGLVGDIYNDVTNSSKTIITNCFNNSSVEAVTSVGRVMRMGGIYGSLAQDGANAEIINCANTGSVTGTNTSENAGNSRFGGIGGIVTAGTVVIKNSYNAGTVSATGTTKIQTGSILGAGADTIVNCYYAEGDFKNKQGTPIALTTIQSEDFVGTLNENVDDLSLSLSSTYPDLLKWKLNTDNYPIQFVAVAQIDGDKYEYLQEAITAANAGDTITLLVDIDLGTEAIAPKKVITLDLNGNTLTAGSFVASWMEMDGDSFVARGMDVVDNSESKTGLLKVTTFTPGNDNSQMPVYNGTGYVFIDFKNGVMPQKGSKESDDAFKLVFKPSFGATNTALGSLGDSAGVSFRIRLTWTDENKIDQSQDLYWSPDLIKKVYGESMAFSVIASSVSNYEGLTITPLVQSTLNPEIEWLGESYSVNQINK